MLRNEKDDHEMTPEIIQTIETKGNFKDELEDLNKGNELLMDDVVDDLIDPHRTTKGDF